MLKKFTDWLVEQIVAIWEAFSQFMSDLFLMWVEHSLNMIVLVVSKLPVPSFLSNESIGSLLGGAGPTVAWLVQTFKVGEGMTMLAAATVFYIVRRLLTLGIW